MKKAIIVLLCMAMLICPSLAVSAESGNGETHQHDTNCVYHEFTFSDPNISNEMKDRIINELTQGIIGNRGGSIICRLAGHDLYTTNTTDMAHNVYSTAPKCEMIYYQNVLCKRCDFSNHIVTGTDRVDCH